MATAYVSARSVAEKLRSPENAGLLAVAIVVYDLASYGGGSARVSEVLERCLAPKELCEKLLKQLESLRVVEIDGDRVRLTPMGRKVIELARWGREL